MVWSVVHEFFFYWSNTAELQNVPDFVDKSMLKIWPMELKRGAFNGSTGRFQCFLHVKDLTFFNSCTGQSVHELWLAFQNRRLLSLVGPNQPIASTISFRSWKFNFTAFPLLTGFSFEFSTKREFWANGRILLSHQVSSLNKFLQNKLDLSSEFSFCSLHILQSKSKSRSKSSINW